MVAPDPSSSVPDPSHPRGGPDPFDPGVFPAVVGPDVIVGGVLWTASIVFFVGQAIAQAASTRPFDLATNLISDLGNTACGPAICSPLHGFMNATFIVVGLCHGFGALATYRAWPRRGLGYLGVLGHLGLLAVAIAGAGLVVAGLAPENVDAAAHATGALLGLVALNLGMIGLGLTVIRARRPLGVLAFDAGVIGFIGLGLFLSGTTGAPGVAERIADYPSAAMIVVLGVYLLVAAVVARRRPLTAEVTADPPPDGLDPPPDGLDPPPDTADPPPQPPS